MAVITTDLNIGAITVTGSVKTGNSDPGTGQIYIDPNVSKLIRIGDKAILTSRIVFDDDDPITMQFGTSIIPSGAEILSVANSLNSGIEVTKSASNSILINRNDSIDADQEVSITLIIDGYEDVDLTTSVEKRSELPLNGHNDRLDTTYFASEQIKEATFKGLQRNDDRSIVDFYYTSLVLNATEFRINLRRVLNGVNTDETLTKPIGDLNIVDGQFEVVWTNEASDLGLTEIKLTVSEAYALIGTFGYTIDQTLLDSNYIFRNEIDEDLQDQILALDTDVMGELDDIGDINLKNHIKYLSVTSDYNELPHDNQMRFNRLEINITAGTCYAPIYIYNRQGVLIRAIEGSGNMTFSVTDWSNVYQEYNLDGYKYVWRADFSDITSNTILSSLTFDNAGLKYPATNTDQEFNSFDIRSNTLGNTVNRRNFDISRFVKLRLIPNNPSFLINGNDLVEAYVNFFQISATRYYMSFMIDGVQYTGAEVAPNSNTGVFEIEFAYPDFTVYATAEWNGIGLYNFNYAGLGNGSARISNEVLSEGIAVATVLSGASGIDATGFNNLYKKAFSTSRVLPYLWKSINWGQSLKIPKINFASITDHNDEPEAMVDVMEWLESDAAIQKAIPCALIQGDMMTALQTNKTTFQSVVTNWLDSIPNLIPILWCLGNHDLGLDGNPALADVPTLAELKTMIYTPLYNRLPQTYKDNFIDSSGTSDMYFYCDVPDSKVRVVSLNQFEYPLVAGTGRNVKYSGTAIRDNGTIVAGFNTYYSEAQLNFLVNALETLPNDSTALIMLHIPINNLADNNGELNSLGNSNEALRQILYSFINKTNENIVVDAIDEIPSFTIPTSFSTRTESNIFAIEGHIHDSRQYSIDVNGNIGNNFPLVVIRCGASGNNSPFISIEGNSISSHGADIICVEDDKKTVEVTRYGLRSTYQHTGIPLGLKENGFSRKIRIDN